MENGLLPLPKDERDLTVGALFLLPKLAELPTDFVLEGYDVKMQDADFCSAFMAVGMSELQEGVALSPEWHFAASQDLYPSQWGQNLRAAMATSVKVGDIELSDAGDNVCFKKDQSFLRDFKNWDQGLKEKAKRHKKQTYLKVTGVGDDAFDTLRKVIWKWRDEKRAIGLGVQFSWPLNQVILDTIADGPGHAMYGIGWKVVDTVPYHVVVNSSGKEVGDKGIHLISREVINHFENIYGAYMFVDLPREDLQYYFDNKIRVNDNWVTQFIKIAWSLLTNSFITPKEKIKIIKDTADTLNEIADKIEPRTPVKDDYVPISNKTALLDTMCEAIKFREGWIGPSAQYPKGTPSFRNLNPGNLKYAGQYGSTGKDSKGFAIFPTYQAGYDALKRQILLVASGKSRAFPTPCTIKRFFEIYAPAKDNNEPLSYATQVAGKMKVGLSWELSDLI